MGLKKDIEFEKLLSSFKRFPSFLKGISGESEDLSASITPSATTSKILIQSYLRLSPYKSSGISASLGATIYRDSTNILTGTQTDAIYVSNNGSSSIQVRKLTPLIYLDSPSSTSSITYAIYVKAESGSTAYYHKSTCQGSIILSEILA